MNAALRYLFRATLKNGAVGQLRRLREPRYAIGAGFVLFYFWANAGLRGPRAPDSLVQSLESTAIQSCAVLLVTLGFATYAWVIRDEEPGLRFTESEIAFLFPAPLDRSELLRFHLAKTQLRLLVSSLAVTLISLRFMHGAAHTVGRVIGTWLVFSAFSFHSLGAGFTRQWLTLRGIGPLVHKSVYGLLVIAAVAVSAHQADFDWAHLGTKAELAEAALALTHAPPVGWVVGPVVAGMNASSWRDAAPLFGLLVLINLALVFWVTATIGRFEDATLRRAQQTAIKESSRRVGAREKKRPSPSPFSLKSVGSGTTAFVWSGLISSGRWARPATLLGLPLLVALGALALRNNPEELGEVLSLAGLLFAAFLALTGPLFARGGVPRMFDQLELVKTLPVSGRSVILGEMLPTIGLLVWAQWSLCLPTFFSQANGMAVSNAALVLSVMVFGPPITAFLTLVPFGIGLYFPAWVRPTGDGPRGFEAIGQRLLFRVVFLGLLLAALVPALALGLAVGGLARGLAASWSGSVVLASIFASAVVVGEVVLALRWLGGRYERFDFSKELAA